MVTFKHTHKEFPLRAHVSAALAGPATATREGRCSCGWSGNFRRWCFFHERFDLSALCFLCGDGLPLAQDFSATTTTEETDAQRETADSDHQPTLVRIVTYIASMTKSAAAKFALHGSAKRWHCRHVKSFGLADVLGLQSFVPVVTGSRKTFEILNEPIWLRNANEKIGSKSDLVGPVHDLASTTLGAGGVARTLEIWYPVCSCLLLSSIFFYLYAVLACLISAHGGFIRDRHITHGDVCEDSKADDHGEADNDHQNILDALTRAHLFRASEFQEPRARRISGGYKSCAA